MPVFNVTSFDRKRKVSIKAETLQSLINSAKTKLNLTGETYQVALDEDGTVVDEDEILLDIAQLSGNAPTKLIVLEVDQTWEPSGQSVTVTNTEAATEVGSSQNAGPSNAKDPVRSENRVQEMKIGPSLWAKFPPRLVERCESGKLAYEADKRNLAATIAEHMLYELKDDSRRTAERFAEALTIKYPASFADIIGDTVVGNGTATFRQQIYTAVQYRKREKELKRKAEMQLSDGSDDDTPATALNKSKKINEYGCAEYQPLLPPSESAKSQKEKKLILIDFCKKGEEDDSKILTLMDETFPTQRIDINNENRNFEKLFTDWPYLSQQKYFFGHASRLLGKSVTEVWEQSLSSNAKPLRKYIAFIERTKIMKTRKTKDINADDKTSSDSEVLQIISQAKEASEASKSEIPMFAAVFPLIAKHFKEDPGLLYRVIAEDVQIDKLTEYATHNYPQLLIRGTSLFDENAKCDVIVEKTVIINARGVVDGFLLTFIAYYVFHYMYPQGFTKSLEFIQRVLLQINPPKGHRRTDKKRKATVCDASVMKLSKALAAFKDDP